MPCASRRASRLRAHGRPFGREDREAPRCRAGFRRGWRMCARSTPSCCAPRRAMATRERRLNQLVWNPTHSHSNASNACASSRRLASVFSAVRCARVPHTRCSRCAAAEPPGRARSSASSRRPSPAASTHRERQRPPRCRAASAACRHTRASLPARARSCTTHATVHRPLQRLAQARRMRGPQWHQPHVPAGERRRSIHSAPIADPPATAGATPAVVDAGATSARSSRPYQNTCQRPRLARCRRPPRSRTH